MKALEAWFLDNPGLPTSLWSALDGKLWHATGTLGFSGIVRDREIRVFRERYYNSLCKMIDGVSLMDFGGTATHLPSQFENWRGWFGDQQDCRVAVWLEIDRHAVAQALLDAGATRALGRDNLTRLFIPGVEACHRGTIPLASVIGVLFIDRYNIEIFEWRDMVCASGAELLKFESRLPPPPPEHPLVVQLERARARSVGSVSLPTVQSFHRRDGTAT
jgi:hypothetical protein